MATSPRATQTKFEPWTDPDAKPYVRIEKVTKKFGDFVAVDEVSLDIYKKEIFCLLGASGCGKTTLLRMLAGFETPDRGRIVLDGQDIGGVPPHRRPVNMMFQSYALFPHLTVWDNIAFGLRREGLARDRVAERAAVAQRMEGIVAIAERRHVERPGDARAGAHERGVNPIPSPSRSS